MAGSKKFHPAKIDWSLVRQAYQRDCEALGPKMPPPRVWFKQTYGVAAAGDHFYKMRAIAEKTREFLSTVDNAIRDSVVAEQKLAIDDFRGEVKLMARQIVEARWRQAVYATKCRTAALKHFGRELNKQDPDMRLVVQIYSCLLKPVQDLDIPEFASEFNVIEERDTGNVELVSLLQQELDSLPETSIDESLLQQAS